MSKNQTAVAETTTTAVAGAAKKTAIAFKRKKLLTRPCISLKAENAEAYVKITSAIYESDSTEAVDPNPGSGRKPKNEEPAKLIQCLDLVTGEESLIVAPSMVVSELNKNYPDNGYVGLCFWIRNDGKKESAAGKRFNVMHVEEIEVDLKELGIQA